MIEMDDSVITEGKGNDRLENAAKLKAELERITQEGAEKEATLRDFKNELERQEQEVLDISKEIIQERLVLLHASLDTLTDSVNSSCMSTKERSESMGEEYCFINRPSWAMASNLLYVRPYRSNTSPETIAKIQIVPGRNMFFRNYFELHGWDLPRNIEGNEDKVDEIVSDLSKDIFCELFPVEPFLKSLDSAIERYASRAEHVLCRAIVDNQKYNNRLARDNIKFATKITKTRKRAKSLRNNYSLGTQTEGEL